MKNKIIVLSIIIIVIIAIVLIIIGLIREEKPINDRSSTTEREKQKEQKEELNEIDFIEKNIGEEVELATLKFRVNKVEEKDIISSKYGTPEVAGEDAKFIVINIDLTNTTDTPFTFSNHDGFVLIDDQGRMFNEYENVIGNIDNYLEQRKLSPSIKENGFFVYKVPKDATSYSLAIGKAGTDEFYKVLLKSTQEESNKQTITTSNNTETQSNEFPEIQTKSYEKTWQTVKSFSGEGTDSNMQQNTDSFKIAGEKWRINWSFKDNSKFASIEGTFAVFAYKINGKPYESLVNVSGAGEGTSYAFGSGEFYLRILTTGGSWNINIEEYK